MTFSLDGLKAKDPVELAELRLSIDTRSRETFLSSPNDSQLKQLTDNTTKIGQNLIRLNIFEVVRNHSVLLESIVIDCLEARSSVSVDVTASVRRWRRAVKDSDRFPSGSLSATWLGGGLCRPRLADQPISARSPVLIIYSGVIPRERSKRASTRKHKSRHGRKKQHRRGESCRRKSMKVNFKQVGWDSWIVAPPEFNAYYCDGLCRIPLGQHMNVTNHAIVQAMINSVSPTKAPGPCCVPTELEQISLLYFDEYGVVKLKAYTSMVAKSCGCR